MSEIIYIKQAVTAFGGRTTAQLKARIAVIDEIIDALESQALTAIASGGVVNYEEYEVNTGQTKNKVIYRDSASVARAVEEYERLRQKYVNKLTPRRIRLIDGKSFN